MVICTDAEAASHGSVVIVARWSCRSQCGDDRERNDVTSHDSVTPALSSDLALYARVPDLDRQLWKLILTVRIRASST